MMTTNTAPLLGNITNNLPTFHHSTKDSYILPADSSYAGGGGGGDGGGGGYYQVYKNATTNFWNWMKQTLPQSKMTTVNDLRHGADAILERNIQSLDSSSNNNNIEIIMPPKSILRELSKSIQYRRLVTAAKFASTIAGGGSDQGHKYMLEILCYCRSVLEFGRHVAKVAIKEQQAGHHQESKSVGAEEEEEDDDDDHKNGNDNHNGIGGRFNALLLEDEDDDDDSVTKQDAENIERSIRQRDFPSFESPQAPPNKHVEDMDIQRDLINGDDRFQAIALLNTMDDLMMAVEQHYAILKRCLRGQEGGYGSSSSAHAGSTIQLLMECTAVSNLATQSVQVAENELQVNHPHLVSFYHVLAVVFLPEKVADLEKQVAAAKKRAAKKGDDGDNDADDPHFALEFVAHIVECAFHNRGQDRLPALVRKFTRKLGLAQTVVENEAHQIFTLICFETQLAMEEPRNASSNRELASKGIRPHMWLEKSEYIGGNACILNTQNIVQKIMDTVQDNKKLVGIPGFWGPQFNENTSPAKTIRGGLDEAFAANILPELIAICTRAPISLLSERSQLLTVIDLLHQHLKGGRTTPVPIALTFGLHAILHSLYVLQGSGDIARVASYAKQSYNTLFAQLDSISDPTKPPENAPNFYWNVNLFKNLVNFAKPVSSGNDARITSLNRDPALVEQLAFWNPLIGGEYMLYGTYMCSIGLGSATVDSLGQLRFTLHLYNALKQRDPSFNVPLLQNLDRVFDKNKAVWVAGRAEKGSYCKSFWLAWGHSLAEASRMGANSAFQQTRPNQALTRALSPILPEEYSASYRRLVQEVYTDESGVADYTILNPTKEGKARFSGLWDLLTRVNMTRDSMDDDEEIVLPVNFPVVGCILLEFTNALCEHMGWNEIIHEVMSSFPEETRTGKTMGGRKMKPGGFNASDLNFQRQGMAHMYGAMLAHLDSGDSNDMRMDADRVVAFMSDFFQAIAKERYTFFIEKDEKPQQPRRTPLEGSYPYGRTGRTMQDPLLSFVHYKYNKRRQPLARLIKPGRYTPYATSQDGEVCTPYQEQGSKMTRGRNGKYRHIASYSMDELISLGWDGAMYVSTQARHAAQGHYVPFICGYDSDADDDYEPIDIQAGKRAGTIGLSDDNGLYMSVYNPRSSKQELVTIQNAR